MRQSRVRMRHPKVANEITVLESTVAAHVASGWRIAEEPKSAPAAPASSVPDPTEEASEKPAARRGRRTTSEPTTDEES